MRNTQNIRDKIYVVVPAAGMSSRMEAEIGSSKNKLLIALSDGSLVIERTILSLVNANIFSGIVLSVREDEIEQMSNLLNHCAPGLDNAVVIGGKTRQESVYCGLMALNGKAALVAVHDGARPACPPKHICAVVEKALETKAAILATPVVPTLKKVSGSLITETIPRADIWEAQTPQVFDYQILKEAHDKAIADCYIATDDSDLVERLGILVSVVTGSRGNIKVTTKDDLDFLSK